MQVEKSILISCLLIVLQSKLIESWKMKACVNGTIYTTEENSNCSAGVWFDEPTKISSLCFEKGMWAVYEDWCHVNPFIWSAYPFKKGCVTAEILKKKVLGIVYLGDHENGGIISTLGKRLFLSNKDLESGQRIIDLVDGNSLEGLVWGISHSYALEQRMGMSREQKCLIKPRTSFFASYYFEFENTKNMSLYIGENLCMDPHFIGERSQYRPKKLKPVIYEAQKDSWSLGERECIPDNNFIGIKIEPNREDFLEHDEDSETIIQNKVDLQTQRIGKRLYAQNFYQDMTFYEDEFEEWKFLEMAATIFQKVCPSGMVSNFFLRNTLHLFKALLYESFHPFPPKVDEDDTTRLRIWEGLKRCEANATMFMFKNDQPCSSETPVLKINAKNGTTILRLLHLPRQIKINVEKFDAISEFAWKLMVFIHYYCAESFNEFSSDLSVLQNRWQSLLAADIIRRWKNPGRSYKMMQKISMSINLEKTIANVDNCVAAAHLTSPYKGWLKRPVTKWETRIKMATKNDQILDGRAYCAKEFDYPALKMGYPIEKCGLKYLKNNKKQSI